MGPHTSFLSPAQELLSPGVKWPGPKSNLSPPSGEKVKKIILLLPHTLPKLPHPT